MKFFRTCCVKPLLEKISTPTIQSKAIPVILFMFSPFLLAFTASLFHTLSFLLIRPFRRTFLMTGPLRWILWRLGVRTCHHPSIRPCIYIQVSRAITKGAAIHTPLPKYIGHWVTYCLFSTVPILSAHGRPLDVVTNDHHMSCGEK
jgi:hypothetical protein